MSETCLLEDTLVLPAIGHRAAAEPLEPHVETPEPETRQKAPVPFHLRVRRRAHCVMQPSERWIVEAYFDSSTDERTETEIAPKDLPVVNKYKTVKKAVERYLEKAGQKGRMDKETRTTPWQIEDVTGLTKSQKLLMAEIMAQEKCWKTNLYLAIQFSITINAIRLLISKMARNGWLSVRWDESKKIRYLVPSEDFLNRLQGGFLSVSKGHSGNVQRTSTQCPEDTRTMSSGHRETGDNLLTGPSALAFTRSENCESPSGVPIEDNNYKRGFAAPSGCCSNVASPPATPPGGAGAPLDPPHASTQPAAVAQDVTLSQNSDGQEMVTLRVKYSNSEAKDISVPREEANEMFYWTIRNKCVRWAPYILGHAVRWTEAGAQCLMEHIAVIPAMNAVLCSDLALHAILAAWKMELACLQAGTKIPYYCGQVRNVNNIFKPHPTHLEIMLVGAAREMHMSLASWTVAEANAYATMTDDLDAKSAVEWKVRSGLSTT